MKPCILFERKGKNLRCLACAHKCLISEDKTGICRVRKNVKGKLMLLVYGKVSSMNVDPIEKKPLYKFLPGSKAFSIGTVGCNFKCDWCQNFDISQFIVKGRNFSSEISAFPNKSRRSDKGNISVLDYSKNSSRKIFGKEITPKEIVSQALATGCKSIAYTYNEPIIFVEFIKDIAVLACSKGLKNIMVTNGYWSKESFEFISDFVDAVNIDLKSFNEKTYLKYCGAKLELVKETIRRCFEKGIHVEVTTLVVPGVNDSLIELEKIAKFLSSVSPKIVWHLSRFFPMYKMTSGQITPVDILEKARLIGKKYLDDVYVGNV